MKNPKDHFERILTYREQGMLCDAEVGIHLGTILSTASPEDVGSLLERVPSGLLPAVRAGLSGALHDITDQEYLRPCASPFGWEAQILGSPYHPLIANLLVDLDEQGRDGILHVVCLPSFEPEWSLRLFGSAENGFSLLLCEPEAQLRASRDPESIVIDRSRAPLETDLGALVRDIWWSMLLRVRYPIAVSKGLDGVNWYFECFGLGAGYLAGKTWSPRPGTAPGKLVELCLAMRRYVKVIEEDRPALVDEIREKGEELRRMRSRTYPL